LNDLNDLLEEVNKLSYAATTATLQTTIDMKRAKIVMKLMNAEQ
jgi:hypothetical protein